MNSIDLKQKPLTSAMEDYIEAIYNIRLKKRVVRVKDIAKRLNVKMPTVTNMLNTLSKRGLIDYQKYEYLELTRKGIKVGKEIKKKHTILRQFLVDILKVDPIIADQEACKMEHGIGIKTLDSLISFMDFIQECPRAGASWLEQFDLFRKNNDKPYNCLTSIKACSETIQKDIKSMEKELQEQ